MKEYQEKGFKKIIKREGKSLKTGEEMKENGGMIGKRQEKKRRKIVENRGKMQENGRMPGKS